jgi:hypothetical protein
LLFLARKELSLLRMIKKRPARFQSRLETFFFLTIHSTGANQEYCGVTVAIHECIAMLLRTMTPSRLTTTAPGKLARKAREVLVLHAPSCRHICSDGRSTNFAS